MAAACLALLRRLAPASHVGRIVPKLVETSLLSRLPRPGFPVTLLERSEIINCRPLCSSRSPPHLPVEFGAKASRPHKSRRGTSLGSKRNAANRTACEVARDRGPLEELPNSTGDVGGEVEKLPAYVSSDFAGYKGMQLVFLGTSSSIPTRSRSTSCVALRLEGSIFLFDCGEGAVRQILQTPMKHYDISTIFITHMHGDHIFGLPGLLCRIGLKEFQRKDPIRIYGPGGLREWIRSTLKASHARVHPKYVVHELILEKRASKRAPSWNAVEENHADELPGKDFLRSSDGLWHIYEDDKYKVTAGPLVHTIPCWGYVVEEHARRGRFNVERAREAGVKPGRYFRMLETGESVTLANGKVVSSSDVLGPPRRGRKVVILGDTRSSKGHLMAAAQEADVVVHEATVLEQDASEIYERGHSTAEMAGDFARSINAGTLVLTHFSRKLDGALFVDEKSHVRETMKDLVSSAQRAFGKKSVIAAEDFMAITVPLVDMRPIQLVNKKHL